jgi:hypothetical protein
MRRLPKHSSSSDRRAKNLAAYPRPDCPYRPECSHLQGFLLGRSLEQHRPGIVLPAPGSSRVLPRLLQGFFFSGTVGTAGTGLCTGILSEALDALAAAAR